MKTILISAYACDPSRGSEPGNGWNWAIGIAKRGYNVHVLALSEGKKEIEKELKEYVSLNLQIHFHYVDHSKFWAKAYYWNFALMYIAYWLWQKKIYTYASKTFKKDEIDFVHHVTWGSLKIGSKLNRLNIPMLFGPVGGGQLTPLKFKQYLGNDYLTEKLRNYLGVFILKNNPLSKKVLKSCQMLVTNTDTLNLVKQYCNKDKSPKLIFDAAIKAPIIHNIIKSNNDKLNLLWVGRIYGFKGLRLIIDALMQIDKEYLAKIHLTIVGDGPDRKAIEEVVNQSNLISTVSFVGMVAYNKVEDYYKHCDAFIYTSLRDSFPSQILEAQLWNLPVITLNLHGQALMVNETNGIKCEVIEPQQTVKQISEAILHMLQNPAERLSMGRKAHEHAIKQTWDKKIDEIVNEFYPKN